MIEIKDILKENHFKKNVSVSLEEIQKKYLDSIDSQKMIFTDDDFKNYIYGNDSSYLSQIEFAFNIFNVFKDKSINFLEIQRKAISNINSEIQLDTNSFIYKDREDLSRFENQDELSLYHINEARSELISILLKEKKLEKSKEKLFKRIANREKSLNRISNDDVFSMYVNSFTSFYDPHTNYMTPKKSRRF